MIELNTTVVINTAQLKGSVRGRAEYTYSQPSYLVEYVDTQGNPRREWFDEYQISQLQ